MAKIRVGIIFGGRSTEHEVSLQSVKNIVDAIDQKRFDVMLLGIDKQGNWYLYDTTNYLLDSEDPTRITLASSTRKVAFLPGYQQYSLMQVNQPNVFFQFDVAFPITHGFLGENGSLQGLLRMVNIPCVGSDVLGSAISMDKDTTKRLLRDAGLTVAPFLTISREWLENIQFEQVSASLGLPLFIKPANQGSSIGVSKVTDRESFSRAIALAFRFDHKIILETAINGREIECAVLGNYKPEVSVCGEVVLRDNLYSYHTKYINKIGAQLVIPAIIRQEISDEIRRIALQAFAALNCIGMARVDVFLTPGGKVFVNEINTIPGFTKLSMYPRLWQASGLNYTDLITSLIMLALERQHDNQKLTSSFAF